MPASCGGVGQHGKEAGRETRGAHFNCVTRVERPRTPPGAPTPPQDGEGGIRTLERACAPYSLSRRVPSATRPPLRTPRAGDPVREGRIVGTATGARG